MTRATPSRLRAQTPPGVKHGLPQRVKPTRSQEQANVNLGSPTRGKSQLCNIVAANRAKERYEETGSTREAAISGVASTAKIITGAALIIITVFSGFAAGKLATFQQMGFGVAVALLLDATLIRTVVLPSSLTLLGERSWYLPKWLEWLPHLEVEPTGSAERDR